MTTKEKIQAAIISIILAPFVACTATCTSEMFNPSEPVVKWNTYADSVKIRIDEAAENKDCSLLDSQFDVAFENSDRHKARFGVRNGSLMNYIYWKADKAGCYKDNTK